MIRGNSLHTLDYFLQLSDFLQNPLLLLEAFLLFFLFQPVTILDIRMTGGARYTALAGTTIQHMVYLMSHIRHHLLQFLLQIGITLALKSTRLAELEVITHKRLILSLLLASGLLQFMQFGVQFIALPFLPS